MRSRLKVAKEDRSHRVRKSLRQPALIRKRPLDEESCAIEGLTRGNKPFSSICGPTAPRKAVEIPEYDR
jgi:hypothetical protein